VDSYWGEGRHEFQERVADAATPAESVRQAEAILLARLERFRRPDDALSHAIALILGSGGCVSIACLADKMGVNSRKLDRTFNTRVGLSPKTLCRIVRFQQIFRLIERSENAADWAQIALDCGYYDQSHFIKEFRTFAGKRPTAYFAEQNSLSDYFTAER